MFGGDTWFGAVAATKNGHGVVPPVGVSRGETHVHFLALEEEDVPQGVRLKHAHISPFNPYTHF